MRCQSDLWLWYGFAVKRSAIRRRRCGSVVQVADHCPVADLASAGDPAPRVDLGKRLIHAFRWIDPGPESSHLVSDMSGWWRDPEILAALGPALAELYRPS